jgi:hypothetical protein
MAGQQAILIQKYHLNTLTSKRLHIKILNNNFLKLYFYESSEMTTGFLFFDALTNQQIAITRP